MPEGAVVLEVHRRFDKGLTLSPCSIKYFQES
jgi:hypothetical protein